MSASSASNCPIFCFVFTIFSLLPLVLPFALLSTLVGPYFLTCLSSFTVQCFRLPSYLVSLTCLVFNFVLLLLHLSLPFDLPFISSLALPYSPSPHNLSFTLSFTFVLPLTFPFALPLELPLFFSFCSASWLASCFSFCSTSWLAFYPASSLVLCLPLNLARDFPLSLPLALPPTLLFLCRLFCFLSCSHSFFWN